MKLHQIYREAIDCLLKIEEDYNYRVNMDSWHANRNGVCEVCLAGAWLAKHIQCPKEVNWFDLNISDDIRAIARAINALRVGDINYAASNLGIQLEGKVDPHYRIVDYHVNRHFFFRDAEKLYKILLDADI